MNTPKLEVGGGVVVLIRTSKSDRELHIGSRIGYVFCGDENGWLVQRSCAFGVETESRRGTDLIPLIKVDQSRLVGQASKIVQILESPTLLVGVIKAMLPLTFAVIEAEEESRQSLAETIASEAEDARLDLS